MKGIVGATLSAALVAGVAGYVVGRVASDPAAPSGGESVREAATGAEEAPAGRRRRTRDGPRPGRVRDAREFDAVGRTMLELRRKQPIHFLGLPMYQIPTDNWLMAELIHDIKPDFIIETGTLWGGSAVYYAAMLELVNPGGRVLTVDINDREIKPESKGHPLWKRHVKFIKGSSIAPEVIEQIAQEVGTGAKVLVTLDTLHEPDHVSRELELYSQFVSPGSYMILQDTYYEGLAQVLEAFLESHPDFQRDRKLDKRFLFSKYEGGFLRRQP